MLKELEGLASKCNLATGNDEWVEGRFYCPLCQHKKPSCSILDVGGVLGASCRVCLADADELFKSVGEESVLPTAITKSEKTHVPVVKPAVSGKKPEKIQECNSKEGNVVVSVLELRKLCCKLAGVEFSGGSQVPCPMPEHSNQHHSPGLKIFDSGAMNCLGGKCGARDEDGKTSSKLICMELGVELPKKPKVARADVVASEIEALSRPAIVFSGAESSSDRFYEAEMDVAIDFFSRSQKHQEFACEYWNCEIEELSSLPVGAWEAGLGLANGVREIFYDDRILVPCLEHSPNANWQQFPITFQAISCATTGLKKKTMFVKGSKMPRVSVLGLELYEASKNPLVLVEGAGDAVVAFLAGYPAAFSGGISVFSRAIDALLARSFNEADPLSFALESKFVCVYDRDEAGVSQMKVDEGFMWPDADDRLGGYTLYMPTLPPDIDGVKDLRDLRKISPDLVKDFLDECKGELGKELPAPPEQEFVKMRFVY